MTIFEQLGKLRAFEKRYLPYLLTVEDFDIVRCVGLGQERGKPLLLKHLYVEGIGSIATVTRRINKLRAEGHLLASSHGADKRNIVLILAPAVVKAFARYAVLLGSFSDATGHKRGGKRAAPEAPTRYPG